MPWGYFLRQSARIRYLLTFADELERPSFAFWSSGIPRGESVQPRTGTVPDVAAVFRVRYLRMPAAVSP